MMRLVQKMQEVRVLTMECPREKLLKTYKNNVFLPKYLNIWNKYITFAA